MPSLRLHRLALSLLLLGISVLAFAPPAALGFQAGDAPQLGEAQAIRLMRTALVARYPVSWRMARGHELACPVGFHARRGGVTQEREIRRRCRFSWSAKGYGFRGRGIIWLGGESAGSREWHVQASVVQEHGERVDVDQLGGVIRCGSCRFRGGEIVSVPPGTRRG